MRFNMETGFGIRVTEILMAGCGIKDTSAGAEFIHFDRGCAR